MWHADTQAPALLAQPVVLCIPTAGEGKHAMLTLLARLAGDRPDARDNAEVIDR